MAADHNWGVIYSAITGTAGLLWSIRTTLRDRSKIHLRGLVMSVTSSDFRIRAGTCVSVTVSNRGRRPMTITHVVWKHRDGSGGMMNPTMASVLSRVPEFPVKVEESGFLNITWPLEAHRNVLPVAFVAVDSHGDEHPMGWRARRKLIREIQKSLAEEPAPTRDSDDDDDEWHAA